MPAREQYRPEAQTSEPRATKFTRLHFGLEFVLFARTRLRPANEWL